MNADVPPHHSFRSTEGAPLFISNDHPHQSSEHAQYVNSQVQEYHHCPQYTQPNQMNSSQTHSKVTLCTQTHSQLPIPEQSNYLTPCVPFIQTHLETTQTPQSYQNTSIQPAQTHTQTIQPQTHTQTIQSQTHSRVQTTDSFSSHSPVNQISDVSLTASKPKVTWKSHDSNSEINISKDPLTELQTVVSVASSSAFTDQVNHFVKNHSDVFEKLFSHFEDKISSCTPPVDLTTSCNFDNGKMILLIILIMIVVHSYHWVRLVSGEIGTLLKILSTLHKVEIYSFLDTIPIMLKLLLSLVHSLTKFQDYIVSVSLIPKCLRLDSHKDAKPCIVSVVL